MELNKAVHSPQPEESEVVELQFAEEAWTRTGMPDRSRDLDPNGFARFGMRPAPKAATVVDTTLKTINKWRG